MWEIWGKEPRDGARVRSRLCRGRIERVGPALSRASPPDRDPTAQTRPQDCLFPSDERVLTLSYLRAEFTREDGAGGAGLGDEAGGDAAPRGDGGNLAERTASGTHGGHLVRSRCGSDCLVVSYTVFQCARVCGYRF